MAPENENYIGELSELKNSEEESSRIGEIFEMGGRVKQTGYKWKIEKEFRNNFVDMVSDYVVTDSFITIGRARGYKIEGNKSGLEYNVALAMEKDLEVNSKPIKKEFFEILDSDLQKDSTLLVQMVSMKKGDLEKITGVQFSKLLSEYPEYFEIVDITDDIDMCNANVKFDYLMTMPDEERNSFLKDANSIYYFLISLEINKKSKPALKAFLDTLLDIEERKDNQRKGNIRNAVKEVLDEDDSDMV